MAKNRTSAEANIMMNKLFKRFTRLLRRILGTEQIFQQLERELIAQRHTIERTNAYLEFATIDEARFKASNKYQHFNQFISILEPMDVADAKYRRVGRDYDGGYVMLDDFCLENVESAYSFGINDDVSWDRDMANMGIDVYMYDHTIEKLPESNPHFHFFREGVTGDSKEKGLQTLSNLVRRNGHEASKNLILKMDIEGCEWNVLQATPSAVIAQFTQIVIELHDLDPTRSSGELSHMISALEKLNQTHQSIHVHANGLNGVTWLGESALPKTLEVTYIRKEDYKNRLVQNTRTFPTEYDRPNAPWLNDIYLGPFAVERIKSYHGS